ncbi:proteoglycan 4-like [Plectropomus leopardus]|uniref:proteoglycan 4-like n=1 Tax=Plectropomus leopardus TaxID=160734 RepID=UPI001C4B6E67|nr:proteoglycan 4-like [Plectropomus leopardus]
MKTIRVLVLLVLASVHVCISDASDESTPTAEIKKQPTSASPDKKLPEAPATSKAEPTAPPIAASTPAPPQPATQRHVASTASPGATSKTPDNKETPAVSTPAPKTISSPPATEDPKITITPPLVQKDNESTANDTVQPKSTQTHVDPDPNSSETILTPGPDDTIQKTDTGKGTATTASASHGTIAPQEMPENQEEKDKEKGSDKRLWWILLPISLVGAAVAIVLKFKCKKIHDHTEAIDTGTENASFQSRPESTKDGVMLLGVKSSGGEENAAAR